MESTRIESDAPADGSRKAETSGFLPRAFNRIFTRHMTNAALLVLLALALSGDLLEPAGQLRDPDISVAPCGCAHSIYDTSLHPGRALFLHGCRRAVAGPGMALRDAALAWLPVARTEGHLSCHCVRLLRQSSVCILAQLFESGPCGSRFLDGGPWFSAHDGKRRPANHPDRLPGDVRGDGHSGGRGARQDSSAMAVARRCFVCGSTCTEAGSLAWASSGCTSSAGCFP